MKYSCLCIVMSVCEYEVLAASVWFGGRFVRLRAGGDGVTSGSYAPLSSYRWTHIALPLILYGPLLYVATTSSVPESSFGELG